MTAPIVAVNLLWCRPGVVGGSQEYLVRQLTGVAAEGGVALRLAVTADFVAAHPQLCAAAEVALAPNVVRSRPARIAAESVWLPGHVADAGLVHHGGGTVPIRLPGLRRRPPVVLTIHDLQYLELPANFSLARRHYLQRMLPRSVAAADVVTVPSGFVRATVLDAFGTRIPADRVVVVPHGVDAPDVSSRPGPDELRRRYDLGARRVVVFPAITHPHKGHRFLLDVLGRWPDDVVLLLLGGPGAADAAVTAAIDELGLAWRVVRPGRVPAADRDGLIALAEALAFPSEYEGFGAPVLEAMALGTPVIASDRTALPEVVGDAGLVLPLDVDAWAGALDRVAAQRPRLTERGRRRAASFTTAASGAALLGAYRRLV